MARRLLNRQGGVPRHPTLSMRGPCMSFFAKLEAAAHRNETLLCIGLDPTPEACPSQFLGAGMDSQAESVDRADRTCEALLAWNRAVIEATSDLVCCYKPNIAFYEAMGKAGMGLPARHHRRHPPAHSRTTGCKAVRRRHNRCGLRARLLRRSRCRCRHTQPLPGPGQHRPLCRLQRQGAVRALPHLQPLGRYLPKAFCPRQATR